jgi:diaminopimelate decarboxylase/aspartate kinase
MGHGHPWWHERKEELVALAERASPCLVYNEEILNDTLFDLLCMEGIEKVFYPVRANAHPAILEKAHSLGTGFACHSVQEVDSLFGRFPDLSPERILLIPDAGRDEKMDRAFHSGVSVVVKSLDALWAWADALKGQDILVGVSSKPGDEWDVEQLEGGNPGIALADVHAFAEGAEKIQTAVVGLYASIEACHMTNTGAVEFFSQWDGIRSSLEKPSVFVLAGVWNDLEGMDLAATGRIVEALQDRYEKAAIWLDPGSPLVSPAGGLLAKGGEVVRQREEAFIETDSGKKIVFPLGGKHLPHEVVNLSRLQGEGGEMQSVSADVLFITNMGAADMYFTGKKKLREAVSEHYLRARSICQVDWRLSKC